MRYHEIITEGRDAPVYHGYDYGKVKWADLALSSNKLAATSTQRFWKDGKRRKDNDPEYKKSFWMKGISTTRDVQYAAAWGYAGVVFQFDQSKLAHKYKIIPFSWAYQIDDDDSPPDLKVHHKREREEFVVLKSNEDTYEPWETHRERFLGPEGYIENLDNYLLGIFVSLDGHKEEPEKFSMFVNHPKLKGFYEQISKTKNKFYNKSIIDKINTNKTA